MPTSSLSRHAFLRLGLAALPGLALSARSVGAQAAVDPVRRERIADAFRMYHLLGSHRTGTGPDNETAEWLTSEVSARGAAATPHAFAFNRVELKATFVEAADTRREGVPFFDGGFTSADGVVGRLGVQGSGAPIVLVTLDQAGISSEGRSLQALRRDPSVKAVVAITDGGMPGLCPSNAADFEHPYGAPVVQVSSTAREWLESVARAGSTLRVVVDASRKPSEATNIIAAIAGTQPNLPPVVVITPRSGWYQCVSERGGGLAIWLELIGAVAQARPARSVRFVASSGHELGHLGLDRYIAENASLVKGAAAWLHLGANIGANNGRLRLQSSSDEIEAIAVGAFTQAGARLDARVPRGTVPSGEARNIHVGGGRYVSMLGNSAYFHNPFDLWPQAVDLDAVVRYADAATAIVLHLARG